MQIKCRHLEILVLAKHGPILFFPSIHCTAGPDSREMGCRVSRRKFGSSQYGPGFWVTCLWRNLYLLDKHEWPIAMPHVPTHLTATRQTLQFLRQIVNKMRGLLLTCAFPGISLKSSTAAVMLDKLFTALWRHRSAANYSLLCHTLLTAINCSMPCPTHCSVTPPLCRKQLTALPHTAHCHKLLSIALPHSAHCSVIHCPLFTLGHPGSVWEHLTSHTPEKSVAAWLLQAQWAYLQGGCVCLCVCVCVCVISVGPECARHVWRATCLNGSLLCYYYNKVRAWKMCVHWTYKTSFNSSPSNLFQTYRCVRSNKYVPW